MIIHTIAAGIGAGMFLINLFQISKKPSITTNNMILAVLTEERCENVSAILARVVSCFVSHTNHNALLSCPKPIVRDTHAINP
jgi:hypothetical protein